MQFFKISALFIKNVWNIDIFMIKYIYIWHLSAYVWEWGIILRGYGDGNRNIGAYRPNGNIGRAYFNRPFCAEKRVDERNEHKQYVRHNCKAYTSVHAVYNDWRRRHKGRIVWNVEVFNRLYTAFCNCNFGGVYTFKNYRPFTAG